MQHLTISHLLQNFAVKLPNAIAVQSLSGDSLSYSQLNLQVVDTLTALRRMGISSQDRVAVALPNGSVMAVAFLAIAAGTTCAPLNPDYRAPEFDYYLQDLQPQALVLLQNSSSPARVVARSLNIPILEICPTPAKGAGTFSLYDDRSILINIKENNQSEELIFATPQDIALVLHTSGTTARPKIVPLTHQNLCQSAANICQTLALTAQDCCLNVMPLFHIHGLVGSLLSTLTMGGSIVCTPGFEIDSFFSWLEEFEPTWYSAVPTIHQMVLEQSTQCNQLLEHHHLRLIRSSSAALPPSVLLALEQVFKVPVVEAYGMTEAAHQMTSNPMPPALRKPGSVGLSAGPEVAIMDEIGNILPSGNIGEVVIRGQNVMLGYANNAEADAKSFVDGWFRTGDQGILDIDGYLHLQGRLKELINRGGEKVVPQEIDNVLLDLPGVSQAVTFAVPHPTLGSDVAAAVVLQSGMQLSPAAIRGFLFDRLADFKVPSQIVIVAEIPKGATGKLQRIGLAEKLQAHLKSVSIKPQTETEKIIAAVFTEVLKTSDISIHDNFFALGGDSLRGTQVANRLSAYWEIDLPNVEIFRKPTISELAAEINRLVSMLSQNIMPFLPIRHRSAVQYLPLSFAQQRMWFLQQLEPESHAYQIPLVLRLQGSLNVEALQKALQVIVERHESLRTKFIVCNGEPSQVVTPVVNFEISVLNLSDREPTQQSIQLSAELQRAANQVFDLATDLMLRATLVCLNDQEYILQIVMHHIASDGWSRGIFSQELSALYQAFNNGQSNPLAALPIQYADFAQWQREWLSGTWLDNQLVYWKQQLSGAPPCLELPTDYPRPAQLTSRGAVQLYNSQTRKLVIGRELTQSLKTLSQESGVTLFTTILGAIKLLLARLSGQNDIIVGTPIAGRNRIEIEDLIGFFVNTVVLRTDLGNSPTFRELINRVRDVMLDADEHQDMPFEKLVEELQAPRDLSRTPIFQVWVNMSTTEDIVLELSGLDVEPLIRKVSSSKFDLTFYISENGEELYLRLVSNTDLFRAERVEQMLRQYEYLLQQIVVAPDKSIAQYSLITPILYSQIAKEKQKINNAVGQLITNQLFVEFAREDIEQSIPSRFEKQVQKYPKNSAVVTGNYQWTYEILNSWANGIAQNIQIEGDEKPTRVALLLDHDAPMIAAMLGILKTGKTYIVLDATYPEQRLSYILENSAASFIITNYKNLDLANQLTNGNNNLKIIDIDEINQNQLWRNIEIAVNPKSPAYILYTSGTTGKPKGVVQSHQNVLHYICNYTNSLSICTADRISLVASYSFDAAVMDVFGAILNGATIHPINIKEEPDLATRLTELEISIFHSTPTLYRYLLASISDSEQSSKTLFPTVRMLVLGGEEIVTKDIDLYKLYFPDDCLLMSVYGSSEASITTHYLINKQTDISGIYMPIGYAVEGTEVLLLNEAGDNVEVYGEIAIRSDYAALGYWQQPELTKAVFLPDPERKENFIYHTGDLGRLRPNGMLEFVGRKDFQLKIQGIRIEPGEIESTLSQHPQVESVVVVGREDDSGEKRLIAYVVATNLPSTAELRQYLYQILPSYMMPSMFVFLDQLPLTPSGKIDRLSLPAAARNIAQIQDKMSAPRTLLEELLARIWIDVLELGESLNKGVSQVNIHDNFFDMGGHSLISIQLINKIRSTFQIEMPLRQLFESPTIAGLAEYIQKNSQMNHSLSTSSAAIPIKSGGVQRIFFLVPGGHGDEYTMMIYTKLLYLLGSEQPVYGFDSIQQSYTDVESLATKYIQALMSIQPHGPYLLSGECIGGVIAYEMAQQLLTLGQSVDLILIDTACPSRMREWLLLKRKWIPRLQKIPLKLLSKVTNLLGQLWRIKQNGQQSKISDAMITIKDQVPERLSPTYQQIKNYSLITHRYRPKLYSSHLVLFASESFEQQGQTRDWEKFAPNMDVYHLQGDHDTYLGEHIIVNAAYIKSYLDRIQITRTIHDDFVQETHE
jgi:amino acid adenylation domain-containing protein